MDRTGDTAESRSDKEPGRHTQHHKPLGLLDTVGIILRVSKGSDVDLVGFGNFGLSSVSDENGLSSPLDDDLKRKKEFGK